VPVTDSKHPLYGRLGVGGLLNCAMPCRGVYFNEDEMYFAQFWVGFWSSMCLVSTMATLGTFVVDRHRFRYPERAIVFLSACYIFVAVGYIVRLIVGHEAVACDKHGVDSVLRYGTTGPVVCTTVFLLVYYFGMASCLWWLLLSFTWFLAAALKWSHEALAAHSHYYHLVAWLVPAVQTVTALAMSVVDGDPVSGVCYVGTLDVTHLRGFVLAPLCVYLLIGTCFLVMGFVSMCRVRRVIELQPDVAPCKDKLDRFMVRVGVVSVLYTVPASTVIACLFYEQHYRAQWHRGLTCPCQTSHSETSHTEGSTVHTRPDFSVFALKYFAYLVVGITSGFWVWTRKTLESWRHCYRLCRGYPRTGGGDKAPGVATTTVAPGLVCPAKHAAVNPAMTPFLLPVDKSTYLPHSHV
jgi:frizzled protein 5/8